MMLVDETFLVGARQTIMENSAIKLSAITMNVMSGTTRLLFLLKKSLSRKGDIHRTI